MGIKWHQIKPDQVCEQKEQNFLRIYGYNTAVFCKIEIIGRKLAIK